MTLKRKPVADHEKDWTITKERPANPETFDSMFTSSHGELWWARITEDKRQLVVWGGDIGQESATTIGRDVHTTPYKMDEDEKLWLSANLARLKARLHMTAMSRAAFLLEKLAEAEARPRRPRTKKQVPRVTCPACKLVYRAKKDGTVYNHPCWKKPSPKHELPRPKKPQPLLRMEMQAPEDDAPV